MTSDPSRNEYPEEEFEIIEIDVTPFLTEEQKTWPVVRCETAAEEFALEEPLPALTVRVNGGTTSPEGRLPAVVAVLSEQEVALGGSGLEIARQSTDNGAVRATLIPRSVEGARGRLERVARWATAFGSEVAVTVV
jgi:hypothetical protein